MVRIFYLFLVRFVLFLDSGSFFLQSDSVRIKQLLKKLSQY